MNTLSLDALAADPSLIPSLPPHIQADLYRQAARLEADLRAYLLTAGRPAQDDQHAAADKALTIGEAATLLCTSKDSLYRKWRRLDFAYRDPLDGRVKFSRAGLERYVDHHLKRPVFRA